MTELYNRLTTGGVLKSNLMLEQSLQQPVHKFCLEDLTVHNIEQAVD